MDDSLPPSTLGAIGQVDRALSVQPLHSAGLTRVKHAPPGKEGECCRLFTAGDDYLVRILPADNGAASTFEPLVIDDATKSMTWIDADQDYLVTASEDGCIRIYQHSTPLVDNGHLSSSSPTDLVCILARCSLAARCSALERSVEAGKTPRVAICSDELVVKVVDAGDPKRVQLITGHQRGVRAASWSPVLPLLTTSSSDATVKVWDLATSEPACIATIAGVIGPSQSDSELSVEAVWHPSGASFVLPAKTHELVVISNERPQSGAKPEWRKAATFAAPENADVPTPTGEIACMAFCLNGRYLAAATTDGQITVWEWASRRPIRAKKATFLPTSISWHPTSDSLSWADNAGQLTRWKGVVGATLPNPFECIDFVDKQKARLQRQQAEIDDLFDGTGLDDDDDALEDDERDRTSRSHDLTIARRNGSVEHSPERGTRPLRRSHGASFATFQPTSTPMRNSRRYLAFNMIGALVAIDQNTHQSISFEPHDAGSRRKWRFVDHFGYNMASIGGSGALFACPEQEGDGPTYDEDGEEIDAKKGHPSTVYFKPFEMPGAWEMPGSEWSVSLPEGEKAVAVAMGGRRARDGSTDSCSAIVATSKGYLRFFTGSGLQRYIWALGSQIVTMAAGDRSCLVVHRGGLVAEGHQNLRYTVIDLLTLELRQEGLLPLSTDSTLVWAGLNNMDVPAVFDSQGVLMLLDRVLYGTGQARWTPMLDTRSLNTKDGSDHSSSRIKYWPVGLEGSNLLALMLKGQAYPDASSSSRPLIQDISLSIPAVDQQSPFGALEEQFMRHNQLAALSRAFRASLNPDEEGDEYYADILEQPALKPALLEHEADKALLQLIQQACKSDKHQRVLDAARELHSGRTLDAALQIGTFFHLSSLVDRMSALRDHVATRLERDEHLISSRHNNVGVPSSSSRILAASSPAPLQQNDSAAAKRALGVDFVSSSRAQNRSYGAGRRSDLAKLGQSPSSSWAQTPIEASSAAHSGNGQMRGHRDSLEDVDSDQDESLASHRGSPRQSSSKRRPELNGAGGSLAGLSEDEDDMRTSKRAREAPASPFANKTNRSTKSDFVAPTAAASAAVAATAKKNPFARTAGLKRDRSMHKSNSFFDRIDGASAAAGTNAGAAASASQAGRASSSSRTKQTKLFGMMPYTGAPTAAAARPAAAVNPAFGESQTDDDSQNQDSESLRLTLSAAQARDEHSQQLEETQYPGEDEDEETQPTGYGGGVEGGAGDVEDEETQPTRYGGGVEGGAGGDEDDGAMDVASSAAHPHEQPMSISVA